MVSDANRGGRARDQSAGRRDDGHWFEPLGSIEAGRRLGDGLLRRLSPPGGCALTEESARSGPVRFEIDHHKGVLAWPAAGDEYWGVDLAPLAHSLAGSPAWAHQAVVERAAAAWRAAAHALAPHSMFAGGASTPVDPDRFEAADLLWRVRLVNRSSVIGASRPAFDPLHWHLEVTHRGTRVALLAGSHPVSARWDYAVAATAAQAAMHVAALRFGVAANARAEDEFGGTVLSGPGVAALVLRPRRLTAVLRAVGRSDGAEPPSPDDRTTRFTSPDPPTPWTLTLVSNDLMVAVCGDPCSEADDVIASVRAFDRLGGPAAAFPPVSLRLVDLTRTGVDDPGEWGPDEITPT